MKSLILMAAAGAIAAAGRHDATTPEAPAVSCCEEPAESTAARPVFERIVRVDETGKIQGKVVFDGDPPAPKKLTIGAKESEGCAHGGHEVDEVDRSLLVDPKTKGIANVVVTLTAEGVEVKIPEEPVVIDQKNCRFEPHVIVVPKGATLRFDNSDPVSHNIHTFSKKNQQVNKNVGKESNFDQLLDKEETFEVKCDIHPWMKGYVIVTEETHWAVTGADGSFLLADVPPGEYKLAYWHEELGKDKTDAVTVEPGATATTEIEMGEKKAGGGRRRR
jgi:plastocyanin